MAGIEEILIPSIITGIVFYSVFVEIRNQSKLRPENATKQKPVEMSKPVQETIIVESVDPQPIEETKTNVTPKLELVGDESKPSVKPVKDVAYDKDENCEIVDITEDMRRAVIAHEILKRKF